MTSRPDASEYAAFFAGYVSLVPERDVVPVLANQLHEVRELAATIPAGSETHAYGPGKWTVREVFGHMGDGERVFGYRAFSVSRGDRNPLPGFDENEYVAQSGYGRRPLSGLVSEFGALRESNLSMLRGLDAPAWERVGTANGSAISVRALAFIMAGHVRHHLGVLRARYLGERRAGI